MCHKPKKGSHNCDEHGDGSHPCGRMGEFRKLQGIAKALDCPTRWEIVNIIGADGATTAAVREGLADRGHEPTQSGVYYHLSELSDAGVIDAAGYVEEGKGAPMKRWELDRETIEIDLVDGED